jgi:histidinol-phosphate aminotransferase
VNARRSLLSIRADLDEVAAYESPQLPARYRMNTNESPWPPPPEVVDAIGAALERASLNRYPDNDAIALHAALAEHLGFEPEWVYAANGSNEVLLHLLLAFGGPDRRSLTFEPTYSLHTLIARITGTQTVQDRRDGDFRIDRGPALGAVERHRPDVVMVCSPNNPSGGCEPVEVVEELARSHAGLVIVDEAYIEFAAPENHLVGLVRHHPNLVVVRTFSKAWRLAGLRLGYAVGHPEVVRQLARVRLPYHLSTVTQAAGIAALKHARRCMEDARAVAAERDRIVFELKKLGLRVHPSQANFVLFEVPEPDRVWRALLERDILVRNYSNRPGLTRCLRVTAGLPEETDVFVNALREVARG